MKKLLVLTITLLLIGCAANTTSVRNSGLDNHTMGIIPREYTILGPVMAMRQFNGVLGFTIDGVGDFYLHKRGGMTYNDIIVEAQKKYPNVDAVIDIQFDYVANAAIPFYYDRWETAHGLAIRYIREPISHQITMVPPVITTMPTETSTIMQQPDTMPQRSRDDIQRRIEELERMKKVQKADE
ncbi:MAG: hypothetical protein LBB56_03500 [Chitinispirillales bacterium]|jgi:hypothetical protein|nr:hypothetical protein [Chitinispirillales bacterium]